MLEALLGELPCASKTTLLLRQKILDRNFSRGINYQSTWTLFPDKWALVVVSKNIHSPSVPFCQAAAESDKLLSFTGQTFSSSFVQLFTWNVFYNDGIERWILDFILCLYAFSLC
jgi:hypothetical protein